MAPSRRSGPSNEENPNIAAIIAQQLQTILPQIVTQVTNNMNNVNGGNNGCTYKGFMACNPKEYDAKGARGRAAAIGMSWTYFKALLVEEFYPSNEMEKLESDYSRVIMHQESAILKAGILTDEAVSCGILTKGNKKRKSEEESSKKGGGRNDDKRAKVSKGFVAATPYRNGYVGPQSKCPKFRTLFITRGYTLSSGVCFNCQKPGHFVRNCQMPIKQVAPISAVRGNYEPGTYYECGSHEHYQNNCRKLTQAPIGALQDLNIVTGTFSLNCHYATVLIDSGADFSFISIDFAPLLNVRPSFVNPGYVIEVTDGKKLEVDRII
ncbi:putative reverse transcriptase domain-containing protein, partial [Tanacetum coccineum]